MTPTLIIELLVLQLVIFAALVFIFRRVMRGHTETAVQKLQKLNEENLRREMELKRKLDEVEKSYQQRLAEAEQIGQQIKETAQKEAQETRDRLITQAQTERDEITVEAREECRQIKSRALKDVELSILAKAAEVMKLALSTELREILHNHFTDQVLAELATREFPREISEQIVAVSSPQPLSAKQKEKLESILMAKLHHPIKLTETIEPSHICGIHLRIGNLVLDGTLNNNINQVIASQKNSIRNKI